MRRAFVLGLLLLVAAVSAQAADKRWSIALHGGAGVIRHEAMNAESEAAYRAGLSEALEAGAGVLRARGTSLDAVEAAVRVLEDNPLFNAGRGAVFTAGGKNELDASIMDGATRAAGAVAGLTHIRHPIALAREVMAHSPHVMLAGAGAEEFARMRGVEEVDPSFFFTEKRWSDLERTLSGRGEPMPARPPGAPAPHSSAEPPIDDHAFGTVGVVAYDVSGNLAAGTSTGGTTGKRWGRIGDSPIVGAGTYAQNGVCAVSATGTGEYFIRLAVARSICALVELRGMRASAAADDVIQQQLTAMGGDGGVIVMDGQGRATWSFNTEGMYRARLREGEVAVIGVFADGEE